MRFGTGEMTIWSCWKENYYTGRRSVVKILVDLWWVWSSSVTVLILFLCSSPQHRIFLGFCLSDASGLLSKWIWCCPGPWAVSPSQWEPVLQVPALPPGEILTWAASMCSREGICTQQAQEWWCLPLPLSMETCRRVLPGHTKTTKPSRLMSISW